MKHRIVLDGVKAYIDENYCDPEITLHSLSEMFGISSSVIVRTFPKLYGIPPYRYIIQSRLNKAAELLKRDTQAKIDEVAGECGYYDATNFFLAFKKQFGMTPMNYRRQAVNGS